MENQHWRSVCAWCGVHMRGTPNAENVSHGICDRCREAEELKQEPRHDDPTWGEWVTLGEE